MRRRDKLKNIVRANILAEQRYLESKGLLMEGSRDKVKQSLMDNFPRFAESIYTMGHGLTNHQWGEYKMMMNYNNGAIAAVDEDGHYTCWSPSSIRGDGDELSKVEVYRAIDTALRDAGYKSNANIGVSCGQMAEQRYLKSKGLLKENSVTQALMGAANSGKLGGEIYDIVKNFGKNAVLAALQALMGSGDIDPQGVKNIGLIQTIQKLQEGDETIVENAIPLNQWVNPQQRLSAGGYLVFTEYNGEYFRGTARMLHGNIDSVKDVASIPQERYETYLQMYNQRHSDLRQDDTINESGMAHAAGFADGGSGFEEGAIGGVTEMESTRFPYKFYGKPLTLTDSNGQTWETSIKDLTAYSKSGGTNIRIGLNDKPNNIDIKPDGTIIINGLGAGNELQAKVEGESAAMIDTIRSIIAKRQDDTINEYGIKKSSKRIKITESQRRLLKSKGLLKEDYNAPFNTGEMKAFLGGLGFSDMYFKWKNDPEKLKSYFSKVLKGNNLKHFLKLFEVDPLDQELRDYDKQEQKFSQLKAKLSKADWQALIQNYSDTFNVYDKDVATWLTTDDNPEDEFSTFATEGPESKVKAIAADLAAKMVWGEDVEEYHSWEVPLSDGSSGSPY